MTEQAPSRSARGVEQAAVADTKGVEFYFEFASPYAYLSSEVIEPLCGGLGVPLRWKPILLGPIIKRTGARPLFLDGPRGAYSRADCFRWAARHGIPFRHWARQPVNSLKAARGALYLRETQHFPAYVHACFRAHFVAGRDLFDDAVLAAIVEGLGADVPAFFAAIGEPALKQRLADETEAAYDRGVFGAPTFFYGDEMIWGNDRLPLLEELIREDLAREG
ncbi:MAG: 2-hydroxychromene-2-carboxylate isomerase [SAR324 cluster bacterium]|nr:2-hydroxychromene-2-carboxylate isomerase [SAR324 cluster bacterium]